MSGEYEVAYDDWASRYDKEFERYGYFAPQKVFESIRDVFNVNAQNLSVLDVGIGTGLLSAQFKKANAGIYIAGIDLSKKMLAKCKEKSIANDLKHIDFEEKGIPYSDNKFDIVVSSGVFELLDKPAFVIQEMVRVAKPGGVLSFTTEDGMREPSVSNICASLKIAGSVPAKSKNFRVCNNRESYAVRYNLHTARKLSAPGETYDVSQTVI